MNSLPVNLPPPDISTETLPKDLERACRSLEEAFATIVFRKMHEAMVPKSAKSAGGFAKETVEGMMDAQWAHLSSQGEGLGLWRALYRQLEPSTVKSPGGNADEKGMERHVSRGAERLAEGLEKAQSRSLGLRHPPFERVADPGVSGSLRDGKVVPAGPRLVERKGK